MPSDTPTSVNAVPSADETTTRTHLRRPSRPPAPQLDNIPPQLKRLPRWLVWRYSEEPNAAGRFSKVPHNIADKKADYTDPSQWLPLDTVVRQYERGEYDGIGFVLGQGICGLDEDHCVKEDGTLNDGAARHIALLNSYGEFSVSGGGVHSLAFGKLPDGGRKSGNHEVYSENRFFVVTGRKLPDASRSVEHREQELLQLHFMIFGGTTNCPENVVAEAVPPDTVPETAPISQREEEERESKERVSEEKVPDNQVLELIQRDAVAKVYWVGCPEGVNPSDADWALMMKLAFYTRRNVEQMHRLFRLSALGERPKAATRRGSVDYVRYTAERACRKQKAVWNPGKIRPKNSAGRPRRQSGGRPGRPKCQVDSESVRKLRDGGMSWRAIAAALGIGKTTATRLYDAGSGVPKTSQNHEPSQGDLDHAEGGAEGVGRGVSSNSVSGSVQLPDIAESVPPAVPKAPQLNQVLLDQGLEQSPKKFTEPEVTAMTESRRNGSERSRWLDSTPKMQVLAKTRESELTKPLIPGSAGFGGSALAEVPEIEGMPDSAELARASAVLNRAGVRVMGLEGGTTIGVWSDLDGPDVRAALRTFGSDRLPICYLDGAGVPARYKVRQVEGEPVPMSVLIEMKRSPAQPWDVRDRMLNEMGWCADGISWAEWRTRELKRFSSNTGRRDGPDSGPRARQSKHRRR